MTTIETRVHGGKIEPGHVFQLPALWRLVTNLGAVQVNQVQAHPGLSALCVRQQKMAEVEIAVVHAAAVHDSGDSGEFMQDGASEMR